MLNIALYTIAALLLFVFAAVFALAAFFGKLGEVLTPIGKSIIVLSGILTGIIGYYSQKWIDFRESEIQDTRSAISSVEILRAEYMSETEDAYYNDDDDFMDLYDVCYTEMISHEKDKNYCTVDVETDVPIGIDDLNSLADFFDFSPTEAFFPAFSQRLSEQTFTKRHVSPAVIRDALDNFKTSVQRYSIMVDEFKDARKIGQSFLHELAKPTLHNPQQLHQIKVFAHSMCCTVKSTYVNSKELARLGSLQAANLCRLERELIDSLEEQTSFLKGIFDFTSPKNEIAEMRAISAQRECVFTPASNDLDAMSYKLDPIKK